jgi:hypothetical protein
MHNEKGMCVSPRVYSRNFSTDFDQICYWEVHTELNQFNCDEYL